MEILSGISRRSINADGSVNFFGLHLEKSMGSFCAANLLHILRKLSNGDLGECALCGTGHRLSLRTGDFRVASNPFVAPARQVDGTPYRMDTRDSHFGIVYKCVRAMDP